MKIRRILATAVAAAVTTPVVFLSAAPAFADTKPTPASTEKPASDEDPDGDDFAEYEKLLAAVAAAEEKLEELKAKRKAAVQDVRDNKVDEALKTELAAAKAAAEAAKTAKDTADAALVTAEEALAALKETGSTATPEEIATAEQAVTAAKTAAEAAAAGKTAADRRLKDADTAFDDAHVELTRKVSRIDAEIVVAEQDLTDAEEALEEFEGGMICEEEEIEKDPSLKVALDGPKTVTAGTGAVFSLRVTNVSDKTLESVQAYAGALQLPEAGDLIDEETDWESRFIQVEWSSADNLEWTEFSEKDDAIEIGKLVKGGSADVKLRLTVDEDAPVGKGVAFAGGAYETNAEDACGMAEDVATAYFDILAAKDDKPSPKPTSATESPEPSPSTTTPTPAPTVTSTGNTGTTQQGGSSRTPVNNGTLAATGANDTLPLGLAAAGAVALGAGALVFARRRKAGANA
ncbi:MULTISPECIES: LPXTG cell wall anchor domain-containing protein [Streptomyces]|uniref:Peptidase n=1 Tax=Streptomyces venezuelae TaxID=54571 RepID=A0A5P2ARQ4_STRVZ|nr:LPXTG cell wall anchor domain-containing protein [Streptomyces venezuelae]QES20507.1 peptidase [Streptomyces venezuelae]